MPIVGLVQRVLSLTSSSYVLFSCGRLPVRSLPRFESYCSIRGHRRFPGAFLTDRSIRGDLILFHLPAATPERFGGIFCSSKTAGPSTSTLAHSNNSSVLYRLCSPTRSETNGPRGVTRLRGWFPQPVPLVVRITDRYRSPPGFLVVITERNNPPRGSR